MIKFSIVTVCLNAGQDLIDTVNSTLGQSYDCFEILVKDGFSTDGSTEQLPEDERIRLIQKKDTGIYDAMNQAVEEALGDYLVFMNCGDRFYSPGVLKEIADGIGEEMGPVYYGNCYNRPTGQVRAYPRTITRMTCYRTMICHQAMVYRADVLREHPYDCSYRIIADRELMWYLVCERGISPRYLDTVIADYKGGGESAKPEHIRRNREDQKRLEERYFPKAERLKYKLLMVLTMQKLRIAWSKSPKLSKSYFGLVRFVYGARDALQGKKQVS